MSYSELSIAGRATIQIGHVQGFSQRTIAGLINRSPSIISRELRRDREACGTHSAHGAQQQMQRRRQACRPRRKLLPGSERFLLRKTNSTGSNTATLMYAYPGGLLTRLPRLRASKGTELQPHKWASV